MWISFCFAIFFLIFSSTVFGADTGYVSPTGTATWPNCIDSGCSGTACCSLSSANTNADAGDIVYLQAGTYTIGASGRGINPSNSGTSSAKITFSNYNSGEVIFDGSDSNQSSGAYINKNYIVINGIKFKDLHWPVFLGHASAASYNEIKYCEIYHSDEGNTNLFHLVHLYPNCTHNWIHHNTIHTMGYSGCSEGAYDLIKLGGAGQYGVDHNTIENNVLYASNHTLTNDYGKSNVWRNNTAHDEGWRDSVTGNIWGTATGGSLGVMIDTTKNFTTLGVEVGYYIYSSSQYMYGGTITSISTTTNPNDTINFAGTTPFSSGYRATFANGHGYGISSCIQMPDASGSYPGNGKYAHRSFAVEADQPSVTAKYILFESNRMAYAGVNSSNGGSDGFTLMAPVNIVRYNFIYGNDGPGINLKSLDSGCYGSGCNNRIYNNTIYGNGNQDFSQPTSPTRRTGIFQYSTTYSTGNAIKNNIMYNNGDSIYYGDKADQTWKDEDGNNTNLCSSTDNDIGCTAGDPLLTDTDYLFTDMSSTTRPYLQIPFNSPAKDAGKHLTLVDETTGSGTQFNVDDSTYFQAGSEAICGTTAKTYSTGSCLSGIQADWICIGNVSNCRQISDINYSTHLITVSSSISWTDNDPVWLYKKSDGVQVLYGTAPDIGAYEYNDLIFKFMGSSIRGGALK